MGWKRALLGCAFLLAGAGCPGTPNAQNAGSGGEGEQSSGPRDPETCESNSECSWKCVAPGDSPGCGIPPSYMPDECVASVDCGEGNLCVDVPASNAGCGMNAHRACLPRCTPVGNVVASRDAEALVCDASGRHVPLACTNDDVCPERHACQNGVCSVRRCATSSDCGNGLHCVNGLCYDGPGRCYPCCPP